MLNIKRFLLFVGTAAMAACGATETAERQPAPATSVHDVLRQNADRMLAEGLHTFRFDTFGSEDFWGRELVLHNAIQGEKFGGVAPGLSPKQARTRPQGRYGRGSERGRGRYQSWQGRS